GAAPRLRYGPNQGGKFVVLALVPPRDARLRRKDPVRLLSQDHRTLSSTLYLCENSGWTPQPNPKRRRAGIGRSVPDAAPGPLTSVWSGSLSTGVGGDDDGGRREGPPDRLARCRPNRPRGGHGPPGRHHLRRAAAHCPGPHEAR